jgi:serine/threonine-protein kinase
MPPPLALLVALIIFGLSSIVALLRPREREDTVENGRELLFSGQTQEAIQVFARLASQPNRNAPGRERALYWLARSHEELGEPDAALDCYRNYLTEYVYSSVGPRADIETEQLVRERLSKLGITVVPGEDVRLDSWTRFKAAQERLTARAAGKEVVPRPAVVEPVPPEAPAPLVSPERLAKDERALAVGQRIGEYVLAEKLGEGGFGDVYRALRPVAIKLARDPSVVEHLRQFGTIQGRVHSDRVVRPLEVNLTADPPYVVMELVDGCTLRDLLATRKLSPAEALTILREVALGLKDAHLGGVLHLDLKPENVLISDEGKVKLTDFELGTMTPEAAQAKLSRTLGSSSLDAKISGTIAYMSPEQRDGKVPDARSDIYTFGVLLFEALTGELPQPGDKPSELRRDLTQKDAVDRVFERCFTRLERRYGTVSELAHEVEGLVAKLPVVDLAAVLRAAPEARARVDARASSGRSPVFATPRPQAPPVAEREPIDALISERAMAGRAAEAAAARPPIPEAAPPETRAEVPGEPTKPVERRELEAG